MWLQQFWHRRSYYSKNMLVAILLFLIMNTYTVSLVLITLIVIVGTLFFSYLQRLTLFLRGDYGSF
ncbi:hypothetical protein [Loigolactobacillus backii]|uniref:Uncharacterized protein n=1 Tax=Loigolactobacillus backii TaxID=375175 RepID=A0A192H220_9LACO|nr:hypothetical protein [Loigolactobacillus backii]ANK60276.1 hypothetical protein AYR52_08470 [Loigolactobacillus backii]ANK62282.1 hypothetical protein AYR53_05525 [Loigolactobacillus backii]ANK65158.1 hypothetical protein AYR54_07880 [Loigolactobacillus backii]ANK67717.1 hypothetical protein AYR55_08485 [Loigolactobacillus backii]ANK70705.1 hypothetical protein AYR56_11465 [Loigolactobacillus backii]